MIGDGSRSSQSTPPAAAQKAGDTIYIGTAGVTGVYYPAGGGICRVVNQSRSQHGITCSMESTQGSIANIEALRAGELDMAIVQKWRARPSPPRFTEAPRATTAKPG